MHVLSDALFTSLYQINISFIQRKPLVLVTSNCDISRSKETLSIVTDKRFSRAEMMSFIVLFYTQIKWNKENGLTSLVTSKET